MRTTTIPTTLALLCLTATSPVLANGDVDLLSKMSQLQYLTHKAELAVEHENRPLAGFYAHELHEVLEAVETIDSYDGLPVGKLADRVLGPALRTFDARIDEGNWPAAEEALDGVVRSCNACHDATEHGFIRIRRDAGNRYMQDFAPPEAGE